MDVMSSVHTLYYYTHSAYSKAIRALFVELPAFEDGVMNISMMIVSARCRTR